MLKALLAVVLISVGCGSAQPPRGEKYTPVNSPEPRTSCVPERGAANAAREDQLGDRRPEARAKVASAVFAHAECELGHLRRQTIPGGPQRAIMMEIRILRDAFQTVDTLLKEARHYDDPTITVGALLRLGDMNRMYADKLKSAPGPVDLKPGHRQAFKSDLAGLAVSLEKQAAISYLKAVDAADAAEGGDMDEWLRAACAGLVDLDPTTAGRRVVCRNAR